MNTNNENDITKSGDALSGEKPPVIPEAAYLPDSIPIGEKPPVIREAAYLPDSIPIGTVPIVPESPFIPDSIPVGAGQPTHMSDSEVIAHTAGVWQYKEISDDGTEQHSEFHQKRIEKPYGEIVAARVRGKKHKHEGTNCDDFFECAMTDDFAICVVCDGAGSKRLSRIGARVCSETAVSFLKEVLEQMFVAFPEVKAGLAADMQSAEFMDSCTKIVMQLQESVRKGFEAQKQKLSEIENDEAYISALGRSPVLSDLSATFLAAVVIPLEIGGKRSSFMASVQIGDGCICAIDSSADAEHCFKLMGEADSGKFSGETDFISDRNTDPAALAGRTRVSRGESDVIMLMSDGVADDYFPVTSMMKRLYLDLCLNNILPAEGEHSEAKEPAPLTYASVSAKRENVALQYAKQLIKDSTEDEVNALWNRKSELFCHSLEAYEIALGDTPEERLRVWLDNYNERGSFDDRTLAVIRLFPQQ